MTSPYNTRRLPSQDSRGADNESPVSGLGRKTKQEKTLTSSIVAPINLHPHGDVAAVPLWMKSNILGSDWWSELVRNNWIAIIVSAKQLNEARKYILVRNARSWRALLKSIIGGLRITFIANGKRQTWPRDHVYPATAACCFQFLSNI